MENYIKLEEKLKLEFELLKKRKNILSNVRLLFFVLSLVLSFFYFSKFKFIYLILGLLSVIGFVFFVSKSSKVSKKFSIIVDELEIINDIKTDDVIDKHEMLNEEFFNNIYNKDLDILEGSSIFNRLNKTQSKVGNFKLKLLLSNLLISKEQILERQLALDELENKFDWNVKFLTFSKRINLDRFVIFEEFERQFNNFNLRFLPIIFGLINFSICVVLAILEFPKKAVFLWIISVIPLAFLINLFFKNRINKTLSYAFINQNQLENLIALAKHIEQELFTEKLNKQAFEGFVNDGKKASAQLKEVQAAIDGFGSLGFPIIGFLLNHFTLWKLYHTILFEHRVKEVIMNNALWIDNISIYEAFISFAIFNDKYKHFTTPVISDSPFELKLIDAYHPLLEESVVVKNSYETNRSQNITIITGANMAGKSTFLRTIGTNLVLAMNGAKVSAKFMKFYPMDIFTSIRTVDNLSSGDSYFKNEINKLKILIDNLESNKPQYIILDEILKGTNSEDKLIGSRKFLEKLMKSKTNIICFIATHDLELTKMEEDYSKNIINYCFELKNVEENYFSDYKLRKGTTKVMNAIFLMKEFKIID